MDDAELDPDPVAQLAAWFDDALRAGIRDPSAMVLSTAGADGRARGRHVLLKGLGADGLRFFTSYDSIKARQLSENPWASVTFPWSTMAPARQVIVEGDVERLPVEDSDAYFATRDRGSQLGAWASNQSQAIPDRVWLEDRFAELELRFPDVVPRPPRWGGYVLRPEIVELWEGRRDRLHDRFRYAKQPDGAWSIVRLSP